MTDNLTIVPAGVIEKLTAVGPDLQDVMARTRWIENTLRHQPSFYPDDRAPLTVALGTPNFSSDPAIAGGEVTAGAAESVLLDYEVPEHRMFRLQFVNILGRAIVAFGAGQAAWIGFRLFPPSGNKENGRPMRTTHGFATGAGSTLVVVHDSNLILTARWRVECFAFLGAGAGVMRCQASIGGLEYNLWGD